MLKGASAAIESYWRRACTALELNPATGFHANSIADPAISPQADLLVDLVAANRKHATTHLLLDFAFTGLPIRRPGDYWVVLKNDGTPACVVRVTDIEVKPFRAISARDAAREGESNKTLVYWQRIHRAYYRRQCSKWGMPWRDDREVVYEGFDLVHSG